MQRLLRMYYEDHGQGRPLVLLHGGGSTVSASFGALLPRLARGHRVIAVEQQAHGHTQDLERPLSFEQMADDTAALLEKLNLREVEVLGFSNGGMTALQLAVRQPTLVRRLIVCSGFHARSGFIPALHDMFSQPPNADGMPKALRDAYLAAAPKPDLQAFVAKTVAMMRTFVDLTDAQLRAIAAPTLVMQADRDVILPEHAVRLASLVQQGQLAIVPGSRHGTYLGVVEDAPNTEFAGPGRGDDRDVLAVTAGFPASCRVHYNWPVRLKPPSSLAVGGLVAVLAALSFGVTLPFIQAAGQDVGPFTTAMLLYAGACVAAVASRAVTTPSGTRLKRAQLGRLALIAFFGAAVAPTLLAWGLQRVGGSAGALLLNLEAFFTVVLARAFYRELIGRRVAAALSVMLLAGALLGFDAAHDPTWSARGALAVTAATLAWAVDNTLTRPLADSDPLAVVAAKAALGAALTGCLSLVAGEPWPTQGRALALLACGATGYGVSLTLYLHAQRRIGAARTGSIFALAPFVGAATAWLLGASEAGALTWVSGALFAVGVALHLTEGHRHWHRHEAMEHEHAHRHDDGHHTHAHASAVEGEHTHVHRHEPVAHDHSHGPDLHHRHDDA